MPSRGFRILLTPQQEAVVRDALGQGMTQAQAAYLAGVPPHRRWAGTPDRVG